MEKKLIKREVYTPCTELQVREVEGQEQSRTISGYAILFNSPSAVMWTNEYGGEVREVIAPEAITKELLDKSDIKMTMFHDRQLILARSKDGQGTLSYKVDEKGVAFEFEAPKTVDGDKALELVSRGDIAGCSFAFSTYYNDEQYVTKEADGNNNVTFTVRQVLGIYDFTLAADPAYPETECAVRELLQDDEKQDEERAQRIRESIAEMRQHVHKLVY